MNEFMRINDVPDNEEYSKFFMEHLSNEKVGGDKVSGLKLQKKDFAELAGIMMRNAENTIYCHNNMEGIMHNLMFNAEHFLEMEWYTEEQRCLPDTQETVEESFNSCFPLEATVSIQTEKGVFITEDYGNCRDEDLPDGCDDMKATRIYYDPVTRLGTIMISV